MRALALAGVLVALAATASATDPYVVLLGWEEGRFVAGAPVATAPLDPALAGANARSFPLVVDACHREILADLLFAPENQTADLDGVGAVTVPNTFRVEVRAGDALVRSATVREPRYGALLGEVAAGEYTLRLQMLQGADVAWSLRARGHAVFEEPACLPRIVVNEVEANPAGADAGHEWIEIHNADAQAQDLSGWLVVATHGQPASLALPDGTVLAPGGHLVVAFTAGQFLDNENESVELRDGLGNLRDATPALSDAANDVRSWSRSPDGSDAWTFAAATPGAANG